MVKYFDINQPGVSIKCKMICDAVRDNKQAVVFAHGFGGHKDNKAAERFAEAALSKMKKCAIIIFDWPCHGSDVKKKLTLEDCDQYLGYVLQYVREQLLIEKIFAYGTSFGGYLLLKYLHDHENNPFEKVALRCPAIAMGDIMWQRIVTPENKALLEKGKDVQAGFDRKVLIDMPFLEALKENDVRNWEFLDFADDILLLQGTKDELVDPESVKTFAEDNVIEFIPIEGADHRFQDLNTMKLAHSYMIDFYLGKN